MVLGRRCREITESRPKNQLFLKNEEDVYLLLIKGSFWKTSRGGVSQLDVVPYLFWYEPFYHGNFKFKAKLGLGTVLLTFSYHSDSKNGSCNKLFTNWVLVTYQEIQALGFPNSPRKLGLYEKPWACISWYGPCTQLVNSKYKTRSSALQPGFAKFECEEGPHISFHTAQAVWLICSPIIYCQHESILDNHL